MSYRAWTAATSARTDSSLASLSRFLLASQCGYLRRRSSTALAGSKVLDTEGPVRRPGASAAVTDSAAGRRSSRSGELSRDSAAPRLAPRPTTDALADAR